MAKRKVSRGDGPSFVRSGAPLAVSGAGSITRSPYAIRGAQAPIGIGKDGLFGDAFAPPTDPILKDKNDALVVFRDIPVYTDTGTWTVESIRGARADLERGFFSAPATLVDTLYGDDRIQATLGSRTGALFGRPLTHTAANDSSEAIQCASAWSKAWPTFAPQSVTAELKRWAIMLGVAFAQIVWDRTWATLLRLPDGTEVQSQLWRPTLRPWHPKFVYFDFTRRRFIASTQDGPEVIEPGNGKWFVHAPFGQYRGWMHGAARAVAMPWFRKELSWRDWARFNETHGLPTVLLDVPATSDPLQRNAFANAVANRGNGAVMMLPQNVDKTGYDARLLEARDRAFDSFQNAINRNESAITLAIKFQNLTTEIEEGSLAAARQHGHTEQVALEFDESTFSADIYDQGSRVFADFNYGDAELAAHSHWDVTPLEDFQENAKSWDLFWTGVQKMRASGYEMPPDKLETIARRQLGVRIEGLKLAPPVTTGLLGGK